MPNDNAQTQNPHKKVFQLAPVEDNWTITILTTRLRVIENRDGLNLDIGARLMFVYLLDLSVRRSANDSFGVITISQTKLAEKLGMSARTIWNWKKQLEVAGLIWVTSYPIPNAWPVTTFHITALNTPEYFEQRTTSEGFWGNGFRQQRPANPGLGAREPGQMTLPGNGLLARRKNPKNQILPENASGSGNPLPARLATHCEPPPQPVAAGSGNPLRATAATHCEPPPQPVASHRRNPLRAGAATGCEHKKATDTRFQGSIDGGTAPPTDEEWKKRLKKMFPRELEALKTALLQQKRDATSPDDQADIEQRIQAIDLQIFGRTPPTKKVKAASPIPATKKPKLTDAEILEGARYALTNGVTLAESQVIALLQAGEKLPPALAKKFPKLIDQFGRNPVPG